MKMFFLSFLFSAILLTGCDIIQPNVELMKPPQLDSKKASLKNYVDSLLSEGDTLISTTESGDFNTITLVDLDKDGNDEAVVIYQTEQDKQHLISLIFKETDEGWEVLDKINFNGVYLTNLDFADITNDGFPEMIIGSSVEYPRFSREKEFNLFKLNNGKMMNIYTDKLANIVIDDLDQDGIVDFVTIYHDEDISSVLTLYHYEDEHFVSIDSISLPFEGSYYNVVSGLVTPTQKGILLDVGLGSRSASTNIIAVENQTLRNKLQRSYTEPDPLWKDYHVESGDINNDGIMEIATLRIPAGYENNSYATIPYITRFYQWDGKTDLIFINERFYSYSNGFYFDIPTDWEQNYTLHLSDDDSQITFITINENEPLFDIFISPISDAEELPNKIEIARTNTRVYYTNFDDETLLQHFNVLSK
ncbi:hypothetical protein [Cytobacillus sp. IB215665]|uniref:hypothetical protein n=1 Tax=Cytobacillus sp. IB215665 TaxID=3097357 RepID=UPI002A1037A7|nr:hypothetical protein [Cytobacillus sp. IB215665]MDX8366856.1 hypothetical protein [Cytobacillus sp. IB215665]